MSRSARPPGGNPHPLGLLTALALVSLLSPGPPAAAGSPDRTRLVVMLYPEANDGSPGKYLVDQALRAAFRNGPPDQTIEIHNEYLDVSRFPDIDFQNFQIEFLRRKYAGRNVELVVAGLSSGLDFALRHREQLFPGVPIVFCAVDHREVRARTPPPDVIGVPVTMDLAGTLDLALRVHPDTERVFVVLGRSKFDAAWEAEARRTFAAYEDRLRFTYLSGLPMNELLTEAARLPERSIIYYFHVFQDGDGKTYVPAEVAERLSAAANAPVYGHVDTYLGRGVVGGRVFHFATAGEDAARLSLRILGGEKPEAIGVQEPRASSDLFDWRQLRRWGIDEGRLPPGSEVRYKQLGFWDLYRWHIIGVVSLCVFEALLIFGLLVQRLNRRRAEERFRWVVEAAPTGMLMVGEDGTVVLANAQMERLFGYPREEMLGRPVGLLLPERLRDQHPLHRVSFFDAPEVRAVGAGQELFGRRKDGSEFPLEIGLSPVRTEAGRFVLASIADITQRKQAEEGLRESQRELLALTGRLLQAQEAERRRIARELHDDLSQSLALVSVEIDLLGQELPEPGDPFGGRMRELSDQIKQLSSSVHGLSHRLHPSKLEQVGLVAAVRALCTDPTQSHGLSITFTPRPVPGAIPPDTALCLYRIVQEALRNVVKHSGARHVAVELEGTDEGIDLRIADDGSGFDPGSVDDKGGLGLVSMRERLRLVGGTIAIDSQPSCGTRIEVRIPLNGAGPAEDARVN